MTRSGILGIILIVFGLLGLSFLGPGMMGRPGGIPLKTQYTSNGERIYYTGVSERTGPIRFRGGPMWLAMHGGGCVSCHRVDGRGGIPAMTGTAIPPDIRYAVLTEEEAHRHRQEEEERHPPYTDTLIKRAITEGLNPAGKSLDWTMPRWQMTEEDLDDLIAYLKTLR
ncbi:MAG: c-type cytochrome [Candidatus Methylomirabilales bacterium]